MNGFALEARWILDFGFWILDLEKKAAPWIVTLTAVLTRFASQEREAPPVKPVASSDTWRLDL